jgi:hypothetical protein
VKNAGRGCVRLDLLFRAEDVGLVRLNVQAPSLVILEVQCPACCDGQRVGEDSHDVVLNRPQLRVIVREGLFQVYPLLMRDQACDRSCRITGRCSARHSAISMQPFPAVWA